MSSVVVDAVELACAGIAHEARSALSGLSGRRHGRWCRVRAPLEQPTLGSVRSFSAKCHANVHTTRRCNAPRRDAPSRGRWSECAISPHANSSALRQGVHDHTKLLHRRQPAPFGKSLTDAEAPLALQTLQYVCWSKIRADRALPTDAHIAWPPFRRETLLKAACTRT